MKGIANVILSALGWIFFGFCTFGALLYGMNIGSVLLFLTGVMALPLKPIRYLWHFLPHKARPLLKLLILFFAFFFSVALVAITDPSYTYQSTDSTQSTISPSPSFLPSATPEPTVTVTPSPTSTPTATPEPTPEITPSPTPVPTSEPSPTPVPTQTPLPTLEPDSNSTVVAESSASANVNSERMDESPSVSTPVPTPDPTPEPTPEPVEESASNGVMVWIAGSGNGKRYHSNPGCSNMSSPVEISLSDAQASGYTACKRCYG